MGTVIAQMFTCIHVLREDRLCERSHVVTIREKSQSRAAGRALALTHAELERKDMTNFLF